MAVENAAKAVLALLGPVGRTHAASAALRRVLDSGRFSASATSQVTRLAELADQLGWDIHVVSECGDEADRRTPWELFDETAACEALTAAEEAVMVAQRIVDGDRVA